jgi:hypothetical protein
MTEFLILEYLHPEVSSASDDWRRIFHLVVVYVATHRNQQEQALPSRTLMLCS